MEKGILNIIMVLNLKDNSETIKNVGLEDKHIMMEFRI